MDALPQRHVGPAGGEVPGRADDVVLLELLVDLAAVRQPRPAEEEVGNEDRGEARAEPRVPPQACQPATEPVDEPAILPGRAALERRRHAVEVAGRRRVRHEHELDLAPRRPVGEPEERLAGRQVEPSGGPGVAEGRPSGRGRPGRQGVPEGPAEGLAVVVAGRRQDRPPIPEERPEGPLEVLDRVTQSASSGAADAVEEVAGDHQDVDVLAVAEVHDPPDGPPQVMSELVDAADPLAEVPVGGVEDLHRAGPLSLAEGLFVELVAEATRGRRWPGLTPNELEKSSPGRPGRGEEPAVSKPTTGPMEARRIDPGSALMVEAKRPGMADAELSLPRADGGPRAADNELGEG